ncbi:hypothetical protein A6R68_09239 [Neotoma lepida]|uniref:Uncharacterized protein n=1 Tax=Neotoma lepida TaxID=56216 RepID=A0A1A6G2M2_NEOLE|nr:hypothetical protein A6R68_09239 [Neotoma lepida]
MLSTQRVFQAQGLKGGGPEQLDKHQNFQPGAASRAGRGWGTMSTGGSSFPSPPTFLMTPATSGTYTQAADPVPVLIALACIFLLLASCLLFMMLCKPTALDPGRQGAREYMPHHPGSPSEPRLQLWKRLGSLRRSLHSFRRGRPVVQQCPLPGLDDHREGSLAKKL